MVGVTDLLKKAAQAGLKLSVRGTELVIRGPRSAEALVPELLRRKEEILDLVSTKLPVSTKPPVSTEPPEEAGPKLTTRDILAAHGTFVEARKLGGSVPHGVEGVLERAGRQFHADRRAALLSLDETKIRSFLRRYGMNWGIGKTFWAHVHRTRSSPLVGLPDEERRKSEAWLAANPDGREVRGRSKVEGNAPRKAENEARRRRPEPAASEPAGESEIDRLSSSDERSGVAVPARPFRPSSEAAPEVRHQPRGSERPTHGEEPTRPEDLLAAAVEAVRKAAARVRGAGDKALYGQLRNIADSIARMVERCRRLG